MGFDRSYDDDDDYGGKRQDGVVGSEIVGGFIYDYLINHTFNELNLSPAGLLILFGHKLVSIW